MYDDTGDRNNKNSNYDDNSNTYNDKNIDNNNNNTTHSSNDDNNNNTNNKTKKMVNKNNQNKRRKKNCVLNPTLPVKVKLMSGCGRYKGGRPLSRLYDGISKIESKGSIGQIVGILDLDSESLGLCVVV